MRSALRTNPLELRIARKEQRGTFAAVAPVGLSRLRSRLARGNNKAPPDGFVHAAAMTNTLEGGITIIEERAAFPAEAPLGLTTLIRGLKRQHKPQSHRQVTTMAKHLRLIYPRDQVRVVGDTFPSRHITEEDVEPTFMFRVGTQVYPYGAPVAGIRQ